MRLLLLWLHRWTGIILALFVVMIGLSGASLVFHDEIAHQVRVPEVALTSAPSLSADAIAASVRRSFPDWQYQTLIWPEDASSPWFAEVRKGQVGAVGETALAIYLHPQTGEVLKAHDYSRSAWRWLQLLHFNLLSGRNGRLANGILGLATLFSVLTGVCVWWPARRGKPLLRINRSASMNRVMWETHQVAGVYTTAFMIAACLTGSYFAWRGPVHQAIATVFPMRFMNQAVLPINPPPQGKSLPIESFLPAISAMIPAYPVTRVIFPERPDAPIRFIVYEGSRSQFYKASNLFFHPTTGELLRADLIRDRLTGDSIVQWIGAVHYGAFGSWPVKLLWLLGGVLFPVIAITGLIVWMNKRT